MDIHGSQFLLKARVIDDVFVCNVEWNHSRAFLHIYFYFLFIIFCKITIKKKTLGRMQFLFTIIS